MLQNVKHNIFITFCVYGVVWRFEAQTYQTATKFISCTALKISTIRQMHYTRYWGIVLFILCIFCPQSQPVKMSIFVCPYHFSRAWGIFENFFFRAGQAHSFAGLPKAVRPWLSLSLQPKTYDLQMCVTAKGWVL